MSTIDKVKKRAKKLKVHEKREAVWQGPEIDGITQSLLSDFLVCRERFRVKVVEGLQPADTFNHRIEYGSMWHICEEVFASIPDSWPRELEEYVKYLCKKYPTQQPQVLHWYNVCLTQFPIYIDYWKKHSNVKNRKSLLQEETFKVPYELPSGRTVLLRGKWDSVDQIGKGIYLQENKTKGDIKEEQLQRQLRFDLQSMFYLVALREYVWRLVNDGNWPDIKGVIYNVVRRPLSGGKGSIKKLKEKRTKNTYTPEETDEHYYNRLGDIIGEESGYFFMRWKVEVAKEDLKRFEDRFLLPILEQLCDWWEWVSACYDAEESDPFQRRISGRMIHWQHPYGVYNSMDQGYMGDVDEYLETGGEAGLERVENLFSELE